MRTTWTNQCLPVETTWFSLVSQNRNCATILNSNEVCRMHESDSSIVKCCWVNKNYMWLYYIKWQLIKYQVKYSYVKRSRNEINSMQKMCRSCEEAKRKNF